MHPVHGDRCEGLREEARLGVAHRNGLELQSLLSQRGRRVHGAPLNQGGQAAVKEARPIVAYGDVPGETPRRTHSRGSKRRASMNAKGRPSGDGGPNIIGAHHPVDKLRTLLAQARGETRMIKIEPARKRWWALWDDRGIDRDDFEISAFELITLQTHEEVVGAHERMRATGERPDAERLLAPPRPAVQIGGCDHQMIEMACHGRHYHPAWAQALVSSLSGVDSMAGDSSAARASQTGGNWGWGLFVLAAGILLAWFGALGLRELLPADEGRYAQMAREMAASGDWVTIRYNGLKYFEKPPFHLWMSATAFDLFGVGVWQARLWVAISGLVGVAAMALACARWWGRQAGWACALVMLAMPLWTLGAQFNSLDMGVAAALALVLAAFMLAQHPEAGLARRRRWMLVAWAAMGIAVLTKGLIGIVLPGLVLVLYTLWCRDWALWRRLHLGAGLLVCAAVTVPWFALVSARNPEFLHFFFIQEHFQRYTTTMHRRDNPWWFFIPLIVLGCLPWLGLTRVTIRRVVAAGPPASPAGLQVERLLVVWAGAIFLFFSASGSKLPGYILPVLPALAALLSLGLSQSGARSWQGQLLLITGVCLGLAALSPKVGALGTPDTPAQHFEAYARWLLVAALVAAASSLLALGLSRRNHRLPSWTVYSLGMLAATLIGTVGHNEVGRVSSGASLVPAVARVLEPGMPFYGVRRLDHTLPFALQHRLIMVESPDELAFGVQQEPERWIPSLAQFRKAWLEGARALALMTPATFDELSAQGLAMTEIARDSRRVVVANFTVPTP